MANLFLETKTIYYEVENPKNKITVYKAYTIDDGIDIFRLEEKHLTWDYFTILYDCMGNIKRGTRKKVDFQKHLDDIIEKYFEDKEFKKTDEKFVLIGARRWFK